MLRRTGTSWSRPLIQWCQTISHPLPVGRIYHLDQTQFRSLTSSISKESVRNKNTFLYITLYYITLSIHFRNATKNTLHHFLNRFLINCGNNISFGF